MTSPALAQTSNYGRLYRKPQTDPAEVRNVEAALAAGLLMPSVTNVIDTESKSFLQQWAAKQAANAAITAAINYADRLAANPDGAQRWAADAHVRTLNAAAELGDIVHDICESLALGETVDSIRPDVVPYIDAWKRFVDDFQPLFTRVEATMYGECDGPGQSCLPYAGTADFIATIGGVPLVGDYKSGKGVYDSAGMQLSALANATEIATSDQMGLEVPPPIVGGIVVHLRPNQYSVSPVVTSMSGEPWAAFSAFRAAWWTHARSNASYGPVLLGKRVRNPEELVEMLAAS